MHPMQATEALSAPLWKAGKVAALWLGVKLGVWVWGLAGDKVVSETPGSGQ